MLLGQPGLERSGPGRGSAGQRVRTGRGLRGRRPRETATATTGRVIQKFRGKRKILGNPIPSPLGFCSDCPWPIFSMTNPRERRCSPDSTCGFSACIYPRAHACIYTRRYVYVCMQAQKASRARCGAGTSRLLRPRSPAFPSEIGLGRGRAPRCSCSPLRQAPERRDPASGRDFRLEDISPAVKRVEGNLSSVLEGYPRSACLTVFHTDIIPPQLLNYLMQFSKEPCDYVRMSGKKKKRKKGVEVFPIQIHSAVPGKCKYADAEHGSS